MNPHRGRRHRPRYDLQELINDALADRAPEGQIALTVAELVERHRTPRPPCVWLSWRALAALIHQLSGVYVNEQTLRNWHGDAGQATPHPRLLAV